MEKWIPFVKRRRMMFSGRCVRFRGVEQMLRALAIPAPLQIYNRVYSSSSNRRDKIPEFGRRSWNFLTEWWNNSFHAQIGTKKFPKWGEKHGFSSHVRATKLKLNLSHKMFWHPSTFRGCRVIFTTMCAIWKCQKMGAEYGPQICSNWCYSVWNSGQQCAGAARRGFGEDTESLEWPEKSIAGPRGEVEGLSSL